MISGSILPSSATAARPLCWSRRRGSSGGVTRASTAIRYFAGCWLATRRRASRDVVLDGMVGVTSDYVRNTAVVSTVLTDHTGGAVKITDFAPRFRTMIGPSVRRNWSGSSSRLPGCRGSPFGSARPASTAMPMPSKSIGSNHITLPRIRRGHQAHDRCTAVLHRPRSAVRADPAAHLVIGPDEPFPADLRATCREFADRTRDYWTEWVRRLSIAYDWQDAIIRAAITLKLSNFEETGAHHRGAYDVDPGGAWIRAHLGLPLLLAARRLFRGQGAQSPRRDAAPWRISSPSFSAIASEDDRSPRLQHRADRPHGRGDRRRPAEAIAATVRCASAMPRSSRSSTTPMAASSSLRCRCSSTAGCRGRATTACSICWNGSATRAARQGIRARRRHLGISRPPARPHPFGGDVLGRLSTACRDRHASRTRGRAPSTGTASPNRCSRDCSSRPGTRSAAPSPPAFGVGRSRRQRLAAGRYRRCRGRRSALRLDGRRHGARTGAREARHALCRARTISACR